ncbi:DUF5000 domain-containing lipoprotein [Arachidicoccus sp.]|uniref:DUF5000 domain-containing lipoprotein n=1 Tax=Arachidicoccus sp. TaxID=1872624 RepID=UPI003D241230
MKKQKLINYISLLCFGLMFSNCTQKTLNKPVVTNNQAPDVVTNIKVSNQNGKAVLTYTLPKNQDLSYIKADYETSPGVITEATASRYTNTLTLNGFGDTLAHIVKLVSINSSGIASASVEVTVHPLTPGFILSRKSLKIQTTFGGFTINCVNPTNDNLAIVSMVDTSGNGTWVQTVGMDNVYSNDSVISATIHNQPSVLRKYAFTIRDQWNHYSDTLFQTMTPVFEQMLDKSKWNTLTLPNDAQILNNGGWCYEYYMWDGDSHPGWPHTYFTVEAATGPQTATIDLGSQHTFSRFQVNPYLEVGNNYYVRGNPKDFEIWGSNSPDLSNPEPDILSDPTWTKLGTFHVIKPSGSPYQTETAADQTAAYTGWQFDFPTGLGAYRYIRIRSLSNWQGSYFLTIAEFTLWGN